MIRVKSCTFMGIHAFRVDIEADQGRGLPQLITVGLPDTSVKESRERIKSAIKNSGFLLESKKITINLSPAHIKKEGPIFDLPMAVALLALDGVITQKMLTPYVFVGELALDGTLRPFNGGLIMTNGLKNKKWILPKKTAKEAALDQNASVYGISNLEELVGFIRGDIQIEPEKPPKQSLSTSEINADFSEVKGHHRIKRAVEIAVSGNHHILFVGPPGSGKTMIAKRIPGVLPKLSWEEAIEVTKLRHAADISKTEELISFCRPFRSPHHTSSAAALSGGGSTPKPGEMSLSHHGVLFLDELPEFRRDALESLRAPLEDQEITLSRVKMQLTYPANFLLAAAMNPCPCGYLNHPEKQCSCSLVQIQKYQSKISGPIFDRLDLQVEVPAISYEKLTSTSNVGEKSEIIRERVEACQKIQKARNQGMLNADISPQQIQKFAIPDDTGLALLEQAMKNLHMSARGYFKILKIARTIADMEASRDIQKKHIAEAITFRFLDRQWWK